MNKLVDWLHRVEPRLKKHIDLFEVTQQLVCAIHVTSSLKMYGCLQQLMTERRVEKELRAEIDQSLSFFFDPKTKKSVRLKTSLTEFRHDQLCRYWELEELRQLEISRRNRLSHQAKMSESSWIGKKVAYHVPNTGWNDYGIIVEDTDTDVDPYRFRMQRVDRDKDGNPEWDKILKGSFAFGYYQDLSLIL